MGPADALRPLLQIPAEALGAGTRVGVRLADAAGCARAFARAIAEPILRNRAQGLETCLIVPPGPSAALAELADLVARERIDCSRVVFLQSEEFLGDDDRPLDPDHPLSLRGQLRRAFYDRLPPELAPPPENRACPDPDRPDQVIEKIEACGELDACFGELGLSGRLAGNEPEDFFVEQFPHRPTRRVDLSAATRAEWAMELGVVAEFIPRRAVTVGMREILSARHLLFHAGRAHLRGVLRVALHGPVSPTCPASYLQAHPHADLLLSAEASGPPALNLP